MSGEGFGVIIKADEMKLCRGWVLRLLQYFQLKQTREINDRVLKGSLEQVGHQITMPVLHAQIRYLEEKGYVETREPTTPDFPMLVCWITAKGIDLHEGSIEDVGVKFGDEDR